jgi:DNA polymerase-3 subunit gamma/tau
MVLIRLAYTADLPPPDEILKALGGSGPVRTQAPAREPATTSAAGPAMEAATAATLAVTLAAGATDPVVERTAADAEDTAEAREADAADSDGDPALEAAGSALPTVRSFADVVDLAGARREAKLKVHLEEHVSLVKFDPAGSIELHLLRGAPKELPNELRMKLNAWTGKRWVVALSNTPGERPLGEALREWAQSHPAVAAVLQHFPGAKFELKPLPGTKPGDTGTG